MKSPQKSPNYFRASSESGSAGWDRTNDRPINSLRGKWVKPAVCLDILLNNNPKYTAGNPQYTVIPDLKSPKSPQMALIHQRPFQVFRILVDMAIDFRQHTAIGMPH